MVRPRTEEGDARRVLPQPVDRLSRLQVVNGDGGQQRAYRKLSRCRLPIDTLRGSAFHCYLAGPAHRRRQNSGPRGPLREGASYRGPFRRPLETPRRHSAQSGIRPVIGHKRSDFIFRTISIACSPSLLQPAIRLLLFNRKEVCAPPRKPQQFFFLARKRCMYGGTELPRRA